MTTRGSAIVNVMPGIIDRRSGLTPSAIEALKERLPPGFPRWIWNRQAMFYRDYWAWYTGDYLAEETEDSDPRDPTYRYPLGINPVVDFSRKLADMLFGQVTDGPAPLVKTAIKPKSMTGEPAEDEEKTKAKLLQNIVNEVWTTSNGRALQAENAILSQFLGGCYFQVCWEPDLAEELMVPITIKNHAADCVLPLWNPNNPWELIECFVIYRLDTATARRQFGMHIPVERNGIVVYAEHWTKEKYSIYLDGQPMRDTEDPDVVYQETENPFGFVPFIYIPRFREGNFYGSSIVDDIRGLALELNARLADVGDGLQDATHRELFVRNVNNPDGIMLNEDGLEATNLGNTRAFTDDPPDAFSINPPVITDALASNPETVRAYLLRAGNISTVAYGEDEGSQRSGVTLEIRLWPMLSITRLQRTFWEMGLNQLARYIIKMAIVKGVTSEVAPDVTLSLKDLRYMLIHQDWAAQVPRDKATFEQTLLNRLAQHGISLERYLEELGERDIEEEMQRIIADQRELLKMNAEFGGTQTTASGNAAGTSSVTKTEPIVPKDEAISEE